MKHHYRKWIFMLLWPSLWGNKIHQWGTFVALDIWNLMHSKVWVGCWLLLCWPAICTVYTTIIVNSSQNLSISVQVDNGITSLLASYIVTSWDRHVIWLPTDPRPLGRMCLGEHGGFSFCDGLATGIKGLKIKSQSRALWSLSVEYDACGQSFQSVPHGEPPPYVKDLQGDEVSFTCISWGFLVSSCWIWCMWPIISIYISMAWHFCYWN